MESTTSIISFGSTAFHAAELIHKFFIDVKTAGGVENDIIVTVVLSVRKSLLCRFDRVLSPFSKTVCSRLFSDDFKLINSGGTVDVTADEQGRCPWEIRSLASFAACVVLPEP